jgi:hypothetical protein
MSPEQADYLLDEWSRWQMEDVIRCGWPRATSFGKAIKPDPRPATVPIDDARAAKTDRVVSKLPKRYRFLIRVHYLDRAPIDVKARRLRMGRNGYKTLIRGVQHVVALGLAQTLESV